jgi:hypothetical protein
MMDANGETSMFLYGVAGQGFEHFHRHGFISFVRESNQWAMVRVCFLSGSPKEYALTAGFRRERFEFNKAHGP